MIQLGVNDLGHLNVRGGDPSIYGETDVGLRYLPGNGDASLESTANGCLCEGWGVGIGDTLESGHADVDVGGVSNLSLVSFTSTASTATSVVDMGTSLRVEHEFTPSASANLYSVKVSITNTSGVDISDLRYTRAMDWDIDPTTFSEVVTIAGADAATNVLFSSDNGFANPDPFASHGSILAIGDQTDTGPADHGAVFDFGFGELLAGETFEFEIFYGAAATEAAALIALSTVGAEVYSFGQPNCDPDGDGLGCESLGYDIATFIFGFKGVGGTPVSPVPLPGAALLLLTGVGGLGALGFKRRPAKA